MILTPLRQTLIVRYARKPIWMPTAPSKLFRIPEHTFYSPEEIERIKQLHSEYKGKTRSIAEFMRLEFYVPATQSGGLPQEFIAREEELDKKLLEENDRENARIAIIKEEMMSRTIKELEEKVIQVKMKKEEELLETALATDEFINENKDNPDFFVTPENIEAMIDKAMENQISHEFCIDRNGRKYR